MIRFEEDAHGTPLAPLTCSLTSLFGGSGHTTTTSTSQPWSAQIPYLQQGFGAAQNLFSNYTPQFYPGQQVAPFSGAQDTALNKIIGQAGQTDPTAQAAQQFSTDTLNGKYLNSNPYMDQTAQSVLSQVVPQIQSQFVHGNSMSNPAAAYATAQGATSALAPIEYGQYQQNMDNMLKTAALAPQTQALSYFAPGQMFNAGQAQQQQQQQGINADTNKWNYYQQLPYQQLQNFLGSVTGNYGGTTTQKDPYSINPLAATGSLIGGLQGMGGGFAGLGNAMSGIGSGIAGGLGDLLAFL